MSAFERIALPLALVGIADLLAKHAIVGSFVPGERRTIVPGLLTFTYVENAHGAMGLFGDRPALLVALAILALGVLGWFLRVPLRASAAQVGFGLVAGGAIGNVVDRLVHGYVVDFIALPHFFVFNVADAAITLGLVAIAVPTFAPPRARVPA